MIVVPSATAAQPDSMSHSRNVIGFFDNHHWMRAPQQPNCLQVPWTRTCQIARRIYRHHTNLLEELQRRYQWDWTQWLPDKYARVGACETGYGRRPGNWQHDSGTYVSAFGIIRSAYNDFSRRLGYPGWDQGGRTPRQQYEVAAAIQSAYGWSAWGCGGA